MSYCLCISGNLGKVVLDRLLEKNLSIDAVLTDYKSIEIFRTCEFRRIPCFRGNPRNGKALSWISERKIKIENLLSINYLFILEDDILQNVANYAINFHGSLLPKYRGRTPHVWAIINGEKETGISAHLMNSKCDDGNIVKQIRVEITEDDTGASILQKYTKLYPELVDDIVECIQNNTISSIPQDLKRATYFSKRTPDDGQINWKWQKIRIKNWVRAQAFPYPGAFTYLRGNKIIINKVEYSDLGFRNTDPDGLVMDVCNGCPIVKVPNGALALVDIKSDFPIRKNDIFE